MALQTRPRIAVVLAHGMGEHCFPFGGDKAFRPKYAHPVGERALVNRVIDEVLGAGMERVVVVAGFKGQAIHKLTSEYGAKVTTVDASDYLHGDARPLAEALRSQSISQPVLVVNGDLLANRGDYRKLLDVFALATPASWALVDELDPNEDKLSWVTVRLGADGRCIEEVLGRVPDGRVRLSGLYALRVEDLPAFGRLPDNDRNVYITDVIEQLRSDGAEIGALQAGGPVVHVDRAFDYLEANQLAVQEAVQQISFAPGAYTYVGGKGEVNPEFIFPGCIINAGVRIVMEEGSFIGPYDTREAHLAGLRNPPGGVVPIRIRGDVHLGPRSRIGLNSLIEGNLVVGADSYIDDSVVEKDVLVCNGVVIRRNAVIRSRSVCCDNTRFECGADFEGVAGKGTIYMHPGQCWVVTGEGCDLGAGNFFGTWRFDTGLCSYLIGGRQIKPKHDCIGNASYLGDHTRTGVGVMVAPGTRVGADAMVGIGMLPGGLLEGGYGYLPKQAVAKVRVGLLTRKKRTD